MKYSFYKRIYKERIVEMLNECFPDKAITNKSFTWKHFDKYFQKKSIGMIAVDNEKVCSFVCFTPIVIVRNSKKYLFYSCSVQATLPEYRRRGIVSLMTAKIEKKLGNNVMYLGFSNKSGLNIDLYSKKINYNILGQMVTRYFIAHPILRSRNIFFKEIYDLESVKFIDQTSNYFEFLKDYEYLKWRYLDNPKNNYKYLEIYKNSQIVGFLVIKNSILKYEICSIITNDTNLLSEILHSFSSYAFLKGKLIISYSYLPNKIWEDNIPKFSIKKNIEIFFTVKASSNNDLLSSKNWLIQGGDIQ